MLTFNISEETLSTSIEAALDKILTADRYNNPLYKLVEKAVGSTYSTGTLTPQIEEKIISKLNEFMETDKFDTLLGQAVAKAIAEREVSKKK